MHKLKLDDIELKFPSSWDEMTPEQVIYLSDLIGKYKFDSEIKTEVLLKILHFTVIRSNARYRQGENLYVFKIKHHKPFVVSNRQIAFIVKHLDFLTTEVTDKNGNKIKVLDSKLTKNPVKSFRVGCRKWYGPDDRLFNITFDEFLEADSHFQMFLKTNDEKHLNKLIATLYRRRDKDSNPNNPDYAGDIRLPFNQHLIERNAHRLNRLSISRKLAILFFYQGCRYFLANNFPLVFSSGKKTNGRDYGPLALIDALSGDDVTKNESVRKTLLYDVMVRLQRASELNEKIKEEQKQRKK